MSSYSEQLRDPRWQKKRLEIMQRDDWKCIACGSGEKFLNVHHIEYRRGAAPWEYDDAELHTLCEDCHADEHGKGPKAMRAAEVAARKRRIQEHRANIRAQRPDLADVLDRMDAIDAAMPGAPNDEKDALTMEKMSLVERLRVEFNYRPWKGEL